MARDTKKIAEIIDGLLWTFEFELIHTKTNYIKVYVYKAEECKDKEQDKRHLREFSGKYFWGRDFVASELNVSINKRKINYKNITYYQRWYSRQKSVRDYTSIVPEKVKARLELHAKNLKMNDEDSTRNRTFVKGEAQARKKRDNEKTKNVLKELAGFFKELERLDEDLAKETKMYLVLTELQNKCLYRYHDDKFTFLKTSELRNCSYYVFNQAQRKLEIEARYKEEERDEYHTQIIEKLEERKQDFIATFKRIRLQAILGA